MKVPTPEIVAGTGGHVVQFYDRESDLARAVGAYLSQALRTGSVSIVIATPEHRAAFREELAAAGFAPGELIPARSFGWTRRRRWPGSRPTDGSTPTPSTTWSAVSCARQAKVDAPSASAAAPAAFVPTERWSPCCGTPATCSAPSSSRSYGTSWPGSSSSRSGARTTSIPLPSMSTRTSCTTSAICTRA